jgi:hypothetical protein
MQSANITPGFTLVSTEKWRLGSSSGSDPSLGTGLRARFAPKIAPDESTGPGFLFYAEANVDAPAIWDVFCELSQALIGPVSTLVMGEIEDEPVPLGSAGTNTILELLEPHKYQLAHDGWIQFELVSQEGDLVSKVFVAPTKHFEIWLNDEERFRSIMQNHAIPEVESLELIDEYPLVAMRLPGDSVAFDHQRQLIEHLEEQLGTLS